MKSILSGLAAMVDHREGESHATAREKQQSITNAGKAISVSRSRGRIAQSVVFADVMGGVDVG